MANRYQLAFHILALSTTAASAIARPPILLTPPGDDPSATTPGISAAPESCPVGDDSVIDVTGDASDTGITIEDRGDVTITRRRDHYET